ncbi:hypothetical protein [Streptomyces endophyticus]|uniref:Uncharacterized protein n=1 Tax=Streptomyces endophyticus TaxID=714166 RepID=A0ABU6FAF9_9ACTN|nr:hypothetical protein [Streptomyces endophyticus]MEB8340305.1 hypothetical protein [Streptomyces endophyticus]
MKSRHTSAHRAAPRDSALRRFAETHWAREPVVVPDAPALGLDPADAHAILRTAAEHSDSPPLHLATADGILCEPGPLLPGPADRSLGGYIARLASAPSLGGDGWLLTASDPLCRDFPAWSRVRDALAGLWRYVGWPAVPVAAELAVGDRHRAVTESGDPGAASLTWVIDGELSVLVRPEHTGTEYELRARAGDLVHWPAGSRHLDHRTGPCTTLRVSVPARTASALPLVTEAVHGLTRRCAPHTDTPVALPHPLPARADGRLALPAQLADSARLFTDTLADPDVERALLARWAGLRSAAGLNPAPAPCPAVPLTSRHRLRRVTEVIRVATGPDDALWAANGHVWPVQGRAADRVLTGLRTTHQDTTVADLARSSGLSDRSPHLHGLLRELCRSRAVAVTPPEPRP